MLIIVMMHMLEPQEPLVESAPVEDPSNHEQTQENLRCIPLIFLDFGFAK
jgi:hypothetical protein